MPVVTFPEEPILLQTPDDTAETLQRALIHMPAHKEASETDYCSALTALADKASAMLELHDEARQEEVLITENEYYDRLHRAWFIMKPGCGIAILQFTLYNPCYKSACIHKQFCRLLRIVRTLEDILRIEKEQSIDKIFTEMAKLQHPMRTLLDLTISGVIWGTAWAVCQLYTRGPWNLVLQAAFSAGIAWIGKDCYQQYHYQQRLKQLASISDQAVVSAMPQRADLQEPDLPDAPEVGATPVLASSTLPHRLVRWVFTAAAVIGSLGAYLMQKVL